MFAELQSHYLFNDRFGRPGKGNDKGKVEGLVGYVRRNFMTPLPVAESFERSMRGSLMLARTSILCIWRCWNTRAKHSTRRRPSRTMSTSTLSRS